MIPSRWSGLWVQPLAYLSSFLAVSTICTAGWGTVVPPMPRHHHITSLHCPATHAVNLPKAMLCQGQGGLPEEVWPACSLLHAGHTGHREQLVDSCYRTAASEATAPAEACLALGEYHTSSTSLSTAPNRITAVEGKQTPILRPSAKIISWAVSRGLPKLPSTLLRLGHAFIYQNSSWSCCAPWQLSWPLLGTT